MVSSSFPYPGTRALPRQFLLVVLFAMTAGFAHASMHDIDPGEVPRLDAGEGLLVVGVDTDTAIEALRIQRRGRPSASLIRDIEPGATLQLYALPAGDYYFDHLSMGSHGFWQYQLDDDPEFAFTVQAGRINYPGDLVFRGTGFMRASLRLSNRGLRAMDWLDAHHPGLRDRTFTYSGVYPDPFPAFYRNELAAFGKTAGGKVAAARTAPADDDTPISVENLWKPGRIENVRMNAAGDLVAEVSHEGENWNIDLVNLVQHTRTALLRTAYPVLDLQWKGNRRLLMSGGGFARSVSVIRISDTDAQRPHVEMDGAPRNGWILDLLPGDPTHVLFASRGVADKLLVHKIDVSSKRALASADFDERLRLNRGVKDDITWFADGEGELRAALATRDGEKRLFHSTGGKFREVKTPGTQESFWPVALSPDGELVYALTDADRAQRDLVSFDPRSGTIRATLFSRPGVDVEAPVFDRLGRPVGATHFNEGRLVSEYFDPAAKSLNQRVARAFPGESVLIVDHDDAQRHFVLVVESASRPPAYFHLDTTRNEASLLAESHPWLDGRHWAATHVIHAQGSDGLSIEAYLTLPDRTDGERRPLVVLAHGGPIGVRDAALFDPEVQFIASLGYAVLQVNFRGSEGYGRAFRQAGKGHYGTLIEDDIDAALHAALAAWPLDGKRMCAVGASYGGFSSMISAVRWPERFRCVVSLMGVSDLPLVFTASDSGRTQDGRKALEDVVGDPRADLDGATRSSPLYRFRELKVPLLLVHGTEDQRVDYEHTRRLVRMLALAGRPPAVVTVDGAGHGFVTPEQRKQVWPVVARFLEDHLGDAQAGGADKRTGADQAPAVPPAG
jgi:dipeptidyl aminopeptidase/acylaminoacyl peptidase